MRVLYLLVTLLIYSAISQSAASQKSIDSSLSLRMPDPAPTHTFYKSAKGKLHTQDQIDSIIAEKNQRFRGLKTELKVTGRQVQSDTLFLSFSFTMTQIEGEIAYDSANLVNREKLKTTLGKPLPGFRFKDINGKEVCSEDFKGKPIVINFWFTSCPPCIAEMPEMNRIQVEYKNTDVLFLSMTFESKEKVEQFLKKKEFTYRTIPNVKEYINQFTTLYPVTLFVNRKGIVTSFMNGMPMLDENNPEVKSHKVDSKEFLKNLTEITQEKPL